MKHHEYLKEAIEAHGLVLDAFPTTMGTGGYSDDCHNVWGPAVGDFRESEYSRKNVRIDLGDGRSIVLVSFYDGGGWSTEIGLPDGCSVSVRCEREEE